MKIRQIVRIGVGLLLCGVVWAEPECGPESKCKGAPDWKTLRGKSLQTGLSTNQVDHALGACRKGGLSSAEADALLCPMYAAQQDGLPTDCILSKIEEGMAKRVETEHVVAAAEARLEHLRTARRIIDAQPRGHGRMGGPPRLLTHTCLALESGLSEEVLQSVFKRNGGKRMGRLVHVIEAGETLQLAGLAPMDTRQVLFDCMDRNLTPPELQRIVELVVADHAKGLPLPDIRRRIWGKTE